MPAVSVIVPVFNAERHLDRCLDSLLSQTLQDIEIICVDDASTDSSAAVLDSRASVDARLRVLHLDKNQGVSACRNAGMDISNGEYIAFVDSDDFVDTAMYEALYTKAAAESLDIAKAGVRGFDPASGKPVDPWYGMDLDRRISCQHKAFFLYGFTSAVFKRSFLEKHSIRFPEGLILNEDPVFTSKAVLLADKLALVGGVRYYYTANLQSVTHNSATLRHLESQLMGNYLVLRIMDEYGADPAHHAVVTMLLLEHLFSWCERKDLPPLLTERAAAGLDEFMRGCERLPEVLDFMFQFRSAERRRRNKKEILEKLRNKVKSHA